MNNDKRIYGKDKGIASFCHSITMNILVGFGFFIQCTEFAYDDK